MALTRMLHVSFWICDRTSEVAEKEMLLCIFLEEERILRLL